MDIKDETKGNKIKIKGTFGKEVFILKTTINPEKEKNKIWFHNGNLIADLGEISRDGEIEILPNRKSLIINRQLFSTLRDTTIKYCKSNTPKI